MCSGSSSCGAAVEGLETVTRSQILQKSAVKVKFTIDKENCLCYNIKAVEV